MKHNIRIDFVNFVEAPDESISYPLGILYISAKLKDVGFTNIGFTEYVCLLRKIHGEEGQNRFSLYSKDRYRSLHEDNLEKVIKYLIERNPQLLLLGPITSLHLVELEDFVEKIRLILPDSIILAGGPHFGKVRKLDYEFLNIHKDLNGVIIGEAEEIVSKIANEYYKTKIDAKVNEKFDNKLCVVKGVLTPNNVLKPSPEPKLDKLPLPDIKLLEDYWDSSHVSANYSYRLSVRRNPVVYTDYGYFQGEADWGFTEDDFYHFPTSQYSRFPYGIIVSSRGCPGNCTFCCSQGERRTDSVQNIMEQIKYMNEKHKTRIFVFFESLFTTVSQGELNRVSRLCHELIHSNINIEYMIDIRADVLVKIPDKILDLMIESGCKEFNIGLEKGSDKALKLIQKGTSVKEHREAVNKIRESASRCRKSVLVNGTFILGGPTETYRDVSDTIRHSWMLHLDNASVYPLEISPGTQIYAEAIKNNVISDTLDPYRNRGEYPIYETEEVPLSLMKEIVELNSKARTNYNEFIKSLKEIELKFTPYDYDLSNIRLIETTLIHDRFWEYVDDVFSNSVDSHENQNRITDEINKVESRLVHFYQNNGIEMKEYNFGTIGSNLRSCIASLGPIVDKLSNPQA